MHFLTRKSAATLTRDLEFGREVAFPFVSSLLGNFALNVSRIEAEGGAGPQGTRALLMWGVPHQDGTRVNVWRGT